MPRTNNRKNEDMNSPSKKKQQPEKQKRRSRPDYYDDDDSSVDSHGNLRDLIAYDEESSVDTSDSSWRESKSKKKSYSNKKAASPKRWKGKNKRVIDDDDDDDEEEDTRYRTRKSKPSRRSKYDDDDEEDMDEEEEEPVRRPKRRLRKVATPEESEEENEEEEEEEDEDEDEDEDEEEEDEDYDDEEEEEEERRSGSRRSGGGIDIFFSDLNDALRRPQKPKKYKLSKEPENVRRFVKLVQKEVEPEDGEDIDRDITYFKALTPRAQDRLLTKLHTKVEPTEATIPLKFQILSKEVPPEIERVAIAKYNALQNIDPSTTEYYKAHQWIHGYTQLPIGIYKDLPVKLEDGREACQSFVTSVRGHMDKAIYGHDEAKLQILQFVSNWIANPQAVGNVLSIYGPPGVGKTTLIKEGVAKALGRPFHFITLGGATDASFLDGHSYTYEGSTWGRIADVLMKSKCMNPIIYFDELDKVSETPKGEEINNLLIHLTDGSQNDRFQDKYFTGIDLDLSRCLFIFSHNDHSRVNPILRDRMYNIQVSGFNTKQKLAISDDYLIPEILNEVRLTEKITIQKDVVSHIIEHYTGEEKGVRELKRCIQTIFSKINLLRFYNDPDKVPFSIKGFALPFTLTRDHVELFLKEKKPKVDPSIANLYL